MTFIDSFISAANSSLSTQHAARGGFKFSDVVQVTLHSSEESILTTFSLGVINLIQLESWLATTPRIKGGYVSIVRRGPKAKRIYAELDWNSEKGEIPEGTIDAATLAK